MKLVEEKYHDCNMTHCLEVLKERHEIVVTYSTFRRWCHERQIVKRRKRRRGVTRSRRIRMPNEGLLLQMDGSPHRYNGKDNWCLIAAIDDATSDIPYADSELGRKNLPIRFSVEVFNSRTKNRNSHLSGSDVDCVLRRSSD